jgi:hypothetical protein
VVHKTRPLATGDSPSAGTVETAGMRRVTSQRSASRGEPRGFHLRQRHRAHLTARHPHGGGAGGGVGGGSGGSDSRRRWKAAPNTGGGVWPEVVPRVRGGGGGGAHRRHITSGRLRPITHPQLHRPPGTAISSPSPTTTSSSGGGSGSSSGSGGTSSSSSSSGASARSSAVVGGDAVHLLLQRLRGAAAALQPVLHLRRRLLHLLPLRQQRLDTPLQLLVVAVQVEFEAANFETRKLPWNDDQLDHARSEVH